MKKELEIASKRFKEMEQRKERFLEDYRNTGNKLSLELVNDEQRQMNELMEVVLRAREEDKEMLNLARYSESEWAALTGCSVEELQEDFVKLVRCFHADDDSRMAGVEYCDGTYGCFGCGEDIADLTFEQMCDCIEAGK